MYDVDLDYEKTNKQNLNHNHNKFYQFIELWFVDYIQQIYYASEFCFHSIANLQIIDIYSYIRKHKISYMFCMFIFLYNKLFKIMVDLFDYKYCYPIRFYIAIQLSAKTALDLSLAIQCDLYENLFKCMLV